jgi:hypothetical protein
MMSVTLALFLKFAPAVGPDASQATGIVAYPAARVSGPAKMLGAAVTVKR